MFNVWDGFWNYRYYDISPISRRQCFIFALMQEICIYMCARVDYLLVFI